MATEVQNFLDAVKEGNWYIAHDELTEILDNPDIDKRTVLSAITNSYPSVVEDMLNIKMGRQSRKKSRPTVDDDDSDDGFETEDYATTLQRMPAAQAKAEEQTKEVQNLIKLLQDSIDEEERVKIEERVANINAQHAAWISAEGKRLEQQQKQERLVGEKTKDRGDFGGKSRRKRKNKTKRRKTVKRRKTNKRKSNKKRQ